MKTKDIFMYGLGALIALGFFAVVIYLIYTGKFVDQVGIVIGALIAAFSMVVSYFYGSSKGSQDKDQRIQDELKAKEHGGK